MTSLAPTALTDKQRQKLVEMVKADPYRGLVKAGRDAGITGSKAEIKKLLAADEQFQDALHDARGDLLDQVPSLRVANLFRKLGSLVDNDESSSQFRAIQFGLGLRQISVSDRVELTGPEGGPMEVTNPDVAAAIERFTSTVASLADRRRQEPAARELAGGSES